MTIRGNTFTALATAIWLGLGATLAQAADQPAGRKAPAKVKAGTAATASTNPWQDDFGLATCKFSNSGRNGYIVLDPGHQLVLQHGGTRLQITVLDKTEEVNGVTTRVVEEREWDKGQLTEVSRNYYAICEQTQDVLHFGEDVEVYANGKLVNTDGTWRAGSNSNRPGLVIAGSPRLNMKYYQEIAPGVTLNRGEVVSLSATCKTAAGTFTGCMKVRGTSGMDPKKLEYKYYAPNIGLVIDEKLRLVKVSSPQP
jgi:hypothetical protein